VVGHAPPWCGIGQWVQSPDHVLVDNVSVFFVQYGASASGGGEDYWPGLEGMVERETFVVVYTGVRVWALYEEKWSATENSPSSVWRMLGMLGMVVLWIASHNCCEKNIHDKCSAGGEQQEGCLVILGRS
jgi:hypothetical protein